MVARTFVVPLDGSSFAERALPVARALATRLGGRLVLVAIPADGGADRSQAYLANIAAQHEIPTEVIVVEDRSAAEAIERVVGEAPDRIVCMTSHGRGGLRWAVLGSVAEQVVRHAGRPVVLVGRHCASDWPGRLEHLVVSVDGSSAADRIVPVASEWATALGLGVRVALVIHPLDVEGATHPNKVVDAIVARLEASGLRASAVLLRGSYVAGALADFATALPASMLAMTSHTRTGIARVALGSVAMGVVGLAPCPVLVGTAF